MMFGNQVFDGCPEIYPMLLGPQRLAISTFPQPAQLRLLRTSLTPNLLTTFHHLLLTVTHQ